MFINFNERLERLSIRLAKDLGCFVVVKEVEIEDDVVSFVLVSSAFRGMSLKELSQAFVLAKKRAGIGGEGHYLPGFSID